MAILEEVGLSGLQNRFPNELSGGQQQRVAVARAIVAQPAIILADEPTANLDSKTAWGLLETMRKLNQSKNCTFIFSTHDPNVMRAAQRLVFLHDGVIVDTPVKE
jgi:putative ABC transport system ATP-binding protein